MGVTIVDLAFMHAIAMEGEKDKAARQDIKAKMVSLRREKDDLRDELEKERADKLRLVKETDRGTLEQQVAKASEEAIGKAREGERKARQDKNSFVIDLQKKMEIGGIQMYCIERGSEGMFLPKTELHTQLEAWEREMERAWEEVGNVKAELMRVAAELRQTKKSHESLEGHAQALEEACRRVSREGKKAGTDRDRLEKEIETQKGRQEKRLQKERQQLELEKSKAESCQAQASKTNEIERQRRKKSESKVKKLDKFRLRASRYVDLRKKLHNKDYSQVS